MGLNRSPLVNVISSWNLASVAGLPQFWEKYVSFSYTCANFQMFLGKSSGFLTILKNRIRSRTRVQTVCVAGAGGSVRIFTVLVHVCELSADGSVTGGNAKLGSFLVPRRFILWVLTVARW